MADVARYSHLTSVLYYVRIVLPILQVRRLDMFKGQRPRGMESR